MKGTALLFAVVLSCGFLAISHATSCNTATEKTCAKSMYVTGTCSSDKCACAEPTVPGLYGCQIQQKSTITADFDGHVLTGDTVVLTCDGASGYKWFKDGVTISSSTAETHQISTAEATHSGEYKCQSFIDGVEAMQSNGFTITVEDPLTTKPTVTGMPTKVGAGMDVKLTCSDGPFSSDYVWKVDSTAVAGETSKVYTRTVASGDETKQVTCGRSGKESDAVTFPANFETDITGAEVEETSPTTLIEGEALTLKCKLTDGFQSGTTTLLAYKWKKGGTNIDGANGVLFSKSNVEASDAGAYTCSVTFGTQTEKISEAVTIIVGTSLESDEITASATEPLEGGYLSLTCNYKTADTTETVAYSWKKDGSVLRGVTDKILQFNEVTTSIDGDYSCTVTKEDVGSVTSPAKTIQVTANIEAKTPTITVEPALYGIGTKMTFTCHAENFETPGMTYKWHVAGNEQTSVAKTFTYTATDDDVMIKCQFEFGGKSSQEANKLIEPKNIIAVTIKVYDVPVSNNLKLVPSTKVKVLCDVTLSEKAGSLTYQWQKNNQDISEATSKYYEIPAPTGSNEVFKCKATVDTEEKAAEVIVEKGSATPDQPIIVSVPNTFEPVQEGKYVLFCRSLSYAEGAIFVWKKDGKTISNSYMYTMKSVDESDNGEYKCSITVAGQTTESLPKTVNSKVNEVVCKYSNDCGDAGMNFDTTKCYDGKCKCKSSYDLKGGQCTSGSGMALASIMLVIASLLAHKLF